MKMNFCEKFDVLYKQVTLKLLIGGTTLPPFYFHGSEKPWVFARKLITGKRHFNCSSQSCVSVDVRVCIAYSVIGSLTRYNFLSVCMSVCLPVYLSTCLSVCLSACLYVCQSVCQSICLPVCLSFCLSACLYVCLSVCLFSCLSVCLSVCPSVRQRRTLKKLTDIWHWTWCRRGYRD